MVPFSSGSWRCALLQERGQRTTLEPKQVDSDLNRFGCSPCEKSERPCATFAVGEFRTGGSPVPTRGWGARQEKRASSRSDSDGPVVIRNRFNVFCGSESGDDDAPLVRNGGVF